MPNACKYSGPDYIEGEALGAGLGRDSAVFTRRFSCPVSFCLVGVPEMRGVNAHFSSPGGHPLPWHLFASITHATRRYQDRFVSARACHVEDGVMSHVEEPKVATLEAVQAEP